ncbi:MAG: glycosyltransferase [Candidatus Sumerlaeia bacterium]|nr:glycosyltransferase [Candidatus Sumerlaeia bacterium]
MTSTLPLIVPPAGASEALLSALARRVCGGAPPKPFGSRGEALAAFERHAATGAPALVCDPQHFATALQYLGPERCLLCADPSAPTRALDCAAPSRAGAPPRRLLVQSPLLRLYAEERLRIPPARIELIPPSVEVPTPRADEPRTDIVVFRFAGEDRALVDSLGLARLGRIVEARHGAPDACAALRRAALAVVACSARDAAEGWRETLQAMACGAPLLAARTWAVEPLVVDEAEGLLFAPGDAAEAGRLAGRLADEPDFAARLAARAGAKVSTSLTHEHHALRLAAILAAPKDSARPLYHVIAAHSLAPSEAAQ